MQLSLNFLWTLSFQVNKIFTWVFTKTHTTFWLKIHIILQKLYTLSSLGKLSYLLTNLESHFIPLYKCKISVTPLTNIKWFYLHLHGVFLFLTSLKICCWKLLVFLQSPETQQIFPKYLGWQKSQNKTQRPPYTIVKN